MKDEDFYFVSIFDAIEAIEDYTASGRAEFFKQKIIQDAVFYNLAIIGEAANKISPARQLNFPKIEWKYMVGMRNHIIHEYHNIDLALTWQTIVDDLPALKIPLQTHLKR